MTVEGRGLAASAIAGVRWNYLGGVTASACSLIVGIVLARVLGPRPYGQVIIASTIYGCVQLFVDGGFGQALIQKQRLETIEIRKTFTWQIVVAAKITGVVYLFAPWIARQFHDASAARVVQAMSLMIVIQSMGLVSAALLRRRMRFKAIQSAALVSYLIGYVVVGVPLAFCGAGVWSLVAASLCQCLLHTLFQYSAVRHSVVPCFGLPERCVTRFGGTIVATNLVNWGHGNLDNLAAAQLGPVALGLYGRACNFVYQPMSAVVTGLQSVLMATAAKAQEREGLMRDLTLCAIAVVFGVLGPAYVTFALIPDTAIVGLFGEKWMGILPLALPLALAMPFYGAHCLLGPILCGLGRPEKEFWPQAISCGVAAIAFFAAVRISLAALAWALLGVMLFRFALIAVFAFRFLGIQWRKLLAILAKRMVFALAFGALAWSADQILRAPFHLAAGMRLALLTPFGAAVLGWTIWWAGEVVFGRDAIGFLLSYTHYLPAGYGRQLQIQAHRCTRLISMRVDAATVEPRGVTL